MNEQIDLQAIKGIIRRQKILFLVAFLAIFFLSVIVAFVLPPVYRSQSTILIEEQQIPQEFAQTTITSYVEERLQVITQQIMSRPRLLEIINQFPFQKIGDVAGPLLAGFQVGFQVERSQPVGNFLYRRRVFSFIGESEGYGCRCRPAGPTVHDFRVDHFEIDGVAQFLDNFLSGETITHFRVKIELIDDFQ